MSKPTPGSLNLLHITMADYDDYRYAADKYLANAGIEQKLHTTNEENEIMIEDSKPLSK